MSERRPRFVFPVQLPPSLSDPGVIAAHDWNAFNEVDVLTDHWSRPGWTPGRRSYHWYITLGNKPTLTDLAVRCQQALSAFELDRVSPESLHLTLCGIGFTDEVTEDEARSVAAAAQRRVRGLGPLRFAVGPLAGSPGAVRFSVSPWGALMELHGRLVETQVAVLQDPAAMNDGFRPHVGIAYGNRRRPAAPLRDAIEPLRLLEPAQVTADAVHLVLLRREGHTYQWEKLETLPLAGQCRDH